MVVKDNQPTLREDLDVLFADPALVAATGTYARTVSGGHGRIEQRELSTSTALVGYTDWPDLAQALCVERTATMKATGKQHRERTYAVTSVPSGRAGAPQLLALWREHWAIENQEHWVRDVSLGEDASRVRSGAAPHVLATVRNTVLSLLRAHGYTEIAATRRHLARHRDEALALVGLTRQ